VGYWDVVAFDEFAGKQKRVDKALVDIMKNYMANKSFSRGVETLGAEAIMVFVGNTDHTVPYMLKHSDLFDPLPEKFHDSAFPRPGSLLHPRLGSGHHPGRDVFQRIWLRGRLPG
jgi:ATP-dependent Lon protease